MSRKKTETEFNATRPEDPEQHAKWIEEWRRHNPNPSLRRKLKKLGVSLEEYRELLDLADHRCEACGRDVYEKSETWHAQACADHCHDTGQMRGILCHGCNCALGYAYNDPEVLMGIAQYIKVRDRR